METEKYAAGIDSVASKHSVDQTVERLKALLAAKGVKLFALIDHSGEAETAGFAMRNTKLLIFGNPKAGTPVMLAAPLSAIDLPLKILVWQDEAGSVWLSYYSPDFLRDRYNLPPDVLGPLAAAATFASLASQ